MKIIYKYMLTEKRYPYLGTLLRGNKITWVHDFQSCVPSVWNQFKLSFRILKPASGSSLSKNSSLSSGVTATNLVMKSGII